MMPFCLLSLYFWSLRVDLGDADDPNSAQSQTETINLAAFVVALALLKECTDFTAREHIVQGSCSFTHAKTHRSLGSVYLSQ